MANMSAYGTGPRFLIADDHAMFAEILRVYLEKTYTVVGLSLDGHAMVADAMRLRPDVIVVDVGMPLMNGLDATRRIKEQAPNIKFIFLTMRDDPNLAAAALGLGPIGFVLKHSTGQELLKAVDHVMHGEPYLTPKRPARNTSPVDFACGSRSLLFLVTAVERDMCGCASHAIIASDNESRGLSPDLSGSRTSPIKWNVKSTGHRFAVVV